MLEVLERPFATAQPRLQKAATHFGDLIYLAMMQLMLKRLA